ncbi:MAG TPA: hypothetical protein VFO06_00965, partial [Gemmatimonadales bacterium]|nr:hypothetical protein [Gemmatimonadales bacterium]
PGPELEAAVLGAHGDGAPADGGDKRAGSHIARQLEGRFAEREAGTRGPGRVAGGIYRWWGARRAGSLTLLAMRVGGEEEQDRG